MNIVFDVKAKDIAGRIGLAKVNGKKIETPALMPVYNPNKPLVTVEELAKEFNANALMTNSYMLLKNPELKEKVLSEGLHRMLGFKGIIATDSGSFQLMRYGMVETSNKEIIEFQNNIGSDIGSFLDIPSLPDSYKPRAEEQLDKTLARAEEALQTNFVVNAGVQGAKYLDLREKAAKSLGPIFSLIAVGGIVPLMENYRFTELVDVVATVKKNIPLDRVVHAFGLGHPMVFPLAVALGCDFFDSAAYALFALEDRYLTPEGTKRLNELEYLPCNCPVCIKDDLLELEGDERVKALARHNLYVSFTELDKVKQAIKENRLWELLAVQCRSHPNLYAGFQRMLEYSEWLAELDPITKKSCFYYTGSESGKRTEVLNARARLNRVKSNNLVDLSPFGSVPIEVLDIYPFGTAMAPDAEEKPDYRVTDLEKVRALMNYQFGSGAGELIPGNVKIKRSKTTKRIRWIYLGKELIASVRASDHFILPKEYLAQKLLETFEYPRLRIVLEDDQGVVACVRDEHKSVFAKFVKEVDPELRCGDECLIVDKDDNLLRMGTLSLSPKEVMDFSRGMAARVR